MEEEVRDAVFGNVGTIITFRIGAEDAEFLEKEFTPEFSANDLVNLGKYNIYLRLMIDGIAGSPFSAETLPPIERPKEIFKEEIIKVCRQKYGTPKEIVEKRIAEWAGEYILKEGKQKSPPVELYDVKCNSCGKWIKVPFKPDLKRPVYCKSCLKKADEGERLTEIKMLSLKDLLPKEMKKENREEEQKKPVSETDLKKTLDEALNSKKNTNFPESKKGIINPGESVKF